MYAVIETGGKQYRVEVGTELAVERLEGESGHSITFERVLLVADGEDAAIGRPVVADAVVSAEVVRQDRAAKVIVFKYRPKARRRVKKGHRQEQTVLRVSDIRYNGKSAAEAYRKAEADRKTERQRLEEAAARQAAEDQALADRLAAQQKKATSKADTKGGAKPDSKAAAAKTGAAAKPATRAKPKASTSTDSKAATSKADASGTKKSPSRRPAAAKPADAAPSRRRTTKKDG
jgi:large subunit ribosomal protein L21